MTITTQSVLSFLSKLIRKSYRSPVAAYIVLPIVAVVSLEISLMFLLALTVYLCIIVSDETKKVVDIIEENGTKKDTLFGVDVNIIPEYTESMYGPAFVIEDQIYIQPDSTLIEINESIVLHEQCHVMHDDSFNFLINKVIGTLITLVLVSVVTSLITTWWGMGIALLSAGHVGFILGLVISNFFGKLLETRADLHAVKMSGGNTLVDVLPPVDAAGPIVMLVQTPYFPISTRLWIIRTYNNIVNG